MNHWLNTRISDYFCQKPVDLSNMDNLFYVMFYHLHERTTHAHYYIST